MPVQGLNKPGLTRRNAAPVRSPEALQTGCVFVAGAELLLACLQGNDITLVARQPWQRRQQGGRETQRFELVFREVGALRSVLRTSVVLRSRSQLRPVLGPSGKLAPS